MQVSAISNPRQPLWRWRITDYAGDIVEESRDGFTSVSAAVAAGTERMVSMNRVDRSLPPPSYGGARAMGSRPRS